MPEAPIEELLARIQRHLDERRTAPAVNLPPSCHGDYFSQGVYQALEEAEALAESAYVQSFLTPTALPLIGGLWYRLRAAFHRLVVFYVNRSAAAQTAFNRALTVCLAALVADLDTGGRAETQVKIADLQREIQALRAQLEELRRALEAREATQ